MPSRSSRLGPERARPTSKAGAASKTPADVLSRTAICHPSHPSRIPHNRWSKDGGQVRIKAIRARRNSQ
jgi:hypothetical protein